MFPCESWYPPSGRSNLSRWSTCLARLRIFNYRISRVAGRLRARHPNQPLRSRVAERRQGGSKIRRGSQTRRGISPTKPQRMQAPSRSGWSQQGWRHKSEPAWQRTPSRRAQTRLVPCWLNHSKLVPNRQGQDAWGQHGLSQNDPRTRLPPTSNACNYSWDRWRETPATMYGGRPPLYLCASRNPRVCTCSTPRRSPLVQALESELLPATTY